MKSKVALLASVSFLIASALLAQRGLALFFRAPDFVAHGGAVSIRYPPNTIPAIKLALDKGVRHLHIDVSMTRDFRVVLFRDKMINEKNSASPNPFIGKTLRDLNLVEVKQVNLISRVAYIPTLEEVLELIRSTPANLQVNITDESEEMIAVLVESFEKVGRTENLILKFESLRLLEFSKKTYPGIRTVLCVKNEVQFPEALSSSADIVELGGWSTPEEIRKLHQNNKKVQVNAAATTHDQCELWSSLRRQGVDLILTDDVLHATASCS